MRCLLPQVANSLALHLTQTFCFPTVPGPAALVPKPAAALHTLVDVLYE